MDLAIGAKSVFVMMEHLTKKGESKIVERCSYPLTGVGCVNRIYTDLAVIDVTPHGLRVVEIVDGLTFDELQRLTGVPLASASAGRRGGRTRDRDSIGAMMQRSLHLRRGPHALRPLRRRARQRCAPTTSAPMPIKALMERNAGVDWAAVDDVVYGCANQAGEDNRNVGRMALLLAGLPVEVPGATINRLCGSGMDAVGIGGARDQVRRGGADDRRRRREHEPRAVRDAQGRDRVLARNAVYDTTIGWRFVNPLMKAQYGVDSMPETAENVAADFKVSRARPGRVRAAQPAARSRGVAAGRLPRRSCR